MPNLNHAPHLIAQSHAFRETEHAHGRLFTYYQREALDGNHQWTVTAIHEDGTILTSHTYATIDDAYHTYQQLLVRLNVDPTFEPTSEQAPPHCITRPPHAQQYALTQQELDTMIRHASATAALTADDPAAYADDPAYLALPIPHNASLHRINVQHGKVTEVAGAREITPVETTLVTTIARHIGGTFTLVGYLVTHPEPRFLAIDLIDDPTLLYPARLTRCRTLGAPLLDVVEPLDTAHAKRAAVNDYLEGRLYGVRFRTTGTLATMREYVTPLLS